MPPTADTSDLRSKVASRSTDVQRASGQRQTIAQMITAQREQIARALPKHMDPDRLARIALTTIRMTPQLLQCTQESLLGALMLSAQTGLEPGPLGHVYFVPRRDNKRGTVECQWMLGYKGIIDLARRSGKIRSIEAREVCENDEFRYSYGLEEELGHRPHMAGDRGPVIAVWGMAKFIDGGHYFLVMSRADIDAAKDRSDAGRAGKGPWITDYAAMARKTVIRRMAPYLPLSPEQANTLTHDGTVNTQLTVKPDAEPADMAWLDAESWEEPDPDPEPVTSDDGDRAPITAKQSKALHALLKQKRNAAGDDRLPLLAALIGRDIGSAKELTKDEAGRIIDELQNEPDWGDSEPTGNEERP